jgi:Na+-transporting methylmalonyl-CoA/oxaloacetate decarboxylase gamma subunit
MTQEEILMSDFSEALRIAGVGMGVVFLGLILLALLLTMLNRFFSAAKSETGFGVLDVEPPPAPAGENDSSTAIDVGLEQAVAIAAVVRMSGGFSSEHSSRIINDASSTWRFQGRGRLMATREVGRKRRTG